MTIRTPETTSEMLSRYKERNAQRLLEPDRLEAEVRGLADTWFLLRATEVEGLDINDLRGRWRFLRPLIGKRGFGGQWLADGFHVTDTKLPEFDALRHIEKKLPDFLEPGISNLPYFLDIDEEVAEFTTGAKVLAAAVLDLSSPLLWREAKGLGYQIRRFYTQEQTEQPIIRVRHVTAGLDKWLQNS